MIITAAASCTHDCETADAGDTAGEALPEGMYPLQIGGVSLAASGGEAQPWGVHTRVSETADGAGSVFDEGDAIAVSLAGKTATYTYDGNAWTSDAPLYWQSTLPDTVAAWFPAEDKIDFTHQDQGLTYLLKATEENVSYNQAVSLTFAHRLAKVRVVLDGNQADEVAAVNIYSYPTATINQDQGTLNADETETPAYYPMCAAKYNSTACWEANMAPGTLAKDKSFRLTDEKGSKTFDATLSSDMQLEAGKMYTINLTVMDANTNTIDLSGYSGPKPIVVSGKALIKGNYNGEFSSSTDFILIAEGADVTLSGVTITGSYIACEGNATIRLANGTTNTIDMSGETELSQEESRPGIAIGPAGTTVKITGTGELNVTGSENSPGIGGSRGKEEESLSSGGDYGNIEICGGTITATGTEAGIGSWKFGKMGDIIISGGKVTAIGVEGAGIGASYHASCGNIIISGGDVTAESKIGAGIGSSDSESTCGNIIISGGTVTAESESGAGIGASAGSTCGNIIISGGTVTAESKYWGAGIGTSVNINEYISTCGDIKITGGTVKATRAYGKQHDIGQGDSDTVCGTVTISGDAKVTATNNAVKGYDNWTNP